MLRCYLTEVSAFFFLTDTTVTVCAKYCSIASGHTLVFVHRLKTLNYAVKHNKQHPRKVLLSSFHLNGHALGFHPHTRN